MDNDRIVKIGARALAEESTGVLWDQMTSGQKAAEIARSKRECRAALAAFEEAGLVVVPVEPTEAMLDAGDHVVALGPMDTAHVDDRHVMDNGAWGVGPGEPGSVKHVLQGRRSGPARMWRAMIAAAAKADPQ